MGLAARDWAAQAGQCRDILKQSIPISYQIPHEKLPPKSRLNVAGFPRESGQLSERELLMTETTATDLVNKMGSGTWTAEEVTVAFLKRATIGQQLVRQAYLSFVTRRGIKTNW
jgi:hypothetical protein